MKRALLSVSDKTNLVDLARTLAAHGIELVASGGTARALHEAGLAVTTVEALTGFPEMLGGRVKTLHPAIHGGILARRTPEQLNELAAHNLSAIDLVVVNLYPFQATVAQPNVTLADAIEQIDIGGVALIRAAAKNFSSVTVLADPADYAAVAGEITQHGDTTAETRERLALKAFRHTAQYDATIAGWLETQIGQAPAPATKPQGDIFPARLTLSLDKVNDLRYGENPHQRAALYRLADQVGLADARVFHGKALSYTNWLDVDAAWRAANDFAAPSAAVIKHATPSGIASAGTLVEAYRNAQECDPVSAYGGVVGSNRALDVETARALAEIFTEVVIAPGFDPDALAMLQQKKDLRLVEFPHAPAAAMEFRSVGGSLLAQETDRGDYAEWRVVSNRAPTDEETRALRFAWRAVKHLKSNGIVLVQGTRTVGMGAGQMSRVDSVKIAVEKAGERARGAVLGSDAFFPFADGVEAACRAGITALVEPGGSVRDAEVIETANRWGAALVFTGMRHFRH